MDEDWRNAFGILMCREICDGTGAGIYAHFHEEIRKMLTLLLLLPGAILCCLQTDSNDSNQTAERLI